MVVATQPVVGWANSVDTQVHLAPSVIANYALTFFCKTKSGRSGEHGALIYSRTNSCFDSFTEQAPLRGGIESHCHQRIVTASGKWSAALDGIRRGAFIQLGASSVLNRPRLGSASGESIQSTGASIVMPLPSVFLRLYAAVAPPLVLRVSGRESAESGASLKTHAVATAWRAAVFWLRKCTWP